jgi:hypothetical protein
MKDLGKEDEASTKSWRYSFQVQTDKEIYLVGREAEVIPDGSDIFCRFLSF